MMLKALLKVGIVTGAVAAGVAVAKKVGLAEKALNVVDVVADKVSTAVEEAVVKAVVITDRLLTKFDQVTTNGGLFTKDEAPDPTDIPTQRTASPVGYGDITDEEVRNR